MDEEHSQYGIRNILTRDFVLGFLVLVTVTAGFCSLFPTLSIFLARSGSSEREIGVLIGVFGISALVSRLLVGGALKRYSEKQVIMFGAFLFMLTFIGCTILRPFWPFMAVRIFQGVALASIDTAAFAYIINTIPPAYRGQGVSYFLLAPNVSLAIMPSVAIFMINYYSFTVLFLVCAGLSLGSFLLASKLTERKTIPEGNGRPKVVSLINFRIIVPAVSSFFQTFVWGSLIAFVPLYALQQRIANPGYFFSAIAVMLIAGRSIGGRFVDAYKKENIIMIFLTLFIIAMVMLSVSKNLPMLVFTGCLWGTGTAIFAPASLTYSLEYAGSSDGTAVGTFRAFTDLGQAVGPTVTGLVIPSAGYQMTFLMLALISLVNLFYFRFYVVRKRRT